MFLCHNGGDSYSQSHCGLVYLLLVNKVSLKCLEQTSTWKCPGPSWPTTLLSLFGSCTPHIIKLPGVNSSVSHWSQVAGCLTGNRYWHHFSWLVRYMFAWIKQGYCMLFVFLSAYSCDTTLFTFRCQVTLSEAKIVSRSEGFGQLRSNWDCQFKDKTLSQACLGFHWRAHWTKNNDAPVTCARSRLSLWRQRTLWLKMLWKWDMTGIEKLLLPGTQNTIS